MARVQLDGSRIKDWASFHQQSRLAFGFPDTYGDNLNAWVDCLSYLRDEDGMSKFRLGPDEMLHIELLHADDLRTRQPEIVEELAFCIAELNERYADYGEKPALELKPA
ncbi:MAG TPA: barstar family protein [Burkholderiaceae bacterium]